jgi:hypothetical protein
MIDLSDVERAHVAWQAGMAAALSRAIDDDPQDRLRSARLWLSSHAGGEGNDMEGETARAVALASFVDTFPDAPDEALWNTIVATWGNRSRARAFGLLPENKRVALTVFRAAVAALPRRKREASQPVIQIVPLARRRRRGGNGLHRRKPGHGPAPAAAPLEPAPVEPDPAPPSVATHDDANARKGHDPKRNSRQK